MKDFLNKIHPVDDNILDDYLSLWKPYSLPKKTIMTAANETERYLYFVKKGIQKSYYLNKDKEHIMAFAYAPSFSGVPESFFTQRPSIFYLETITACDFLRISYEAHQAMMKKHREIETLFRKACEEFLVGMIYRHHELMAYDMETRFRNFVKRSPHLLNMLSQKDIASYLRIDQSNFSKLINSISI